MLAFFLLLVIVAIVLGIVGVVAKGLFYLLIIGIVVFLGALLLGALRMRRRPRETAGLRRGRSVDPADGMEELQRVGPSEQRSRHAEQDARRQLDPSVEPPDMGSDEARDPFVRCSAVRVLAVQVEVGRSNKQHRNEADDDGRRPRIRDGDQQEATVAAKEYASVEETATAVSSKRFSSLA